MKQSRAKRLKSPFDNDKKSSYFLLVLWISAFKGPERNSFNASNSSHFFSYWASFLLMIIFSYFPYPFVCCLERRSFWIRMHVAHGVKSTILFVIVQRWICIRHYACERVNMERWLIFVEVCANISVFIGGSRALMYSVQSCARMKHHSTYTNTFISCRKWLQSTGARHRNELGWIMTK